MEKPLLSVIVPIHNGENKIKKTLETIMEQEEISLEIILVNNNSYDNSLYVCNQYSQIDKRIKVFDCLENGTSMARKKGIIEARGQYICFCDQDDLYVDKNSLSKMVNKIQIDNVDIVQFGHFANYMGYNKYSKIDQNKKYTKEELFGHDICGIFGVSKSPFNTPVWNKIYKSSLLKDIISKVTYSLCYAEDQYLNIFAFSAAEAVSTYNEGFYIWQYGGFSSSKESRLVLFEEYEKIRSVEFELIKKYKNLSFIRDSLNIESLYMKKVLICDMILENNEYIEIYDLINRLSNFSFIKNAKQEILSSSICNYDELKFMAGEYTSEEYFKFCKKNMPGYNYRIKYYVLKLMTYFLKMKEKM